MRVSGGSVLASITPMGRESDGYATCEDVGMADVGHRMMIDPHALNDHLPIGVIVVDAGGTIIHANRRAGEMTGYDPDEAIGRSILEFIDERDLDFLTASLAAAPEYDEQLMGPARLRYKSRGGDERWTEYWSFRCPSSFGFDGYIVTLSTESVTDNLANAAYQIASGEPLSLTLESIARAVAGHPLMAVGAFVIPVGPRHHHRFDVVGPWPPALLEFALDPSTPWHDTATTGEPRDSSVDELPTPLARSAAEAGFRSVWIRSVVTQGAHVAATFVAWRADEVMISPNQERHLAEAIGVARLAFDNDEYRRELERAALFDQLTGLGNRSLLARDLADAGSERVTVMYVDLDGFKAVNDLHGHDVGDLVLAAVAQRLRSALREGDSVYRIGGDEFIIVCVGAESDADDEVVTARIADRIVESLTSPFRIGAVTVETGASIGIARRQPGEHTTDIVRRADHALLDAKRAGKARWHRDGAHDGNQGG